ncbi:ATP-binding protein [Paenibacillus sp. FSL H3-0333]|uniref:ATP-binding protein n=2 Tax=unclassified Paenibacillus TaxID=185978 RepID=UPI0030F6171F
MITIKEFNTAYWGRIGTVATPYQFHNKVNAFVGASGSGKTTLMDALRIALGDAKFEYNRAMDHYINKNSNWSVVQVSFWNSEVQGRPFLALGFTEPVVTVCVRLDRSSGDCKREYYMFDGSFYDITNLGQNPKAYLLNKVKYGEYLQKLDTIGLTYSFRKLMLMKPEDVQNVVGMDSNRLFQLIFDIKGQKSIQADHDFTSEKLKEVKNLELQSFEDLSNAKKMLNEFESQKIKFEENETRKINFEKMKLLFLKKKYWNNKNELERQQKLMIEEELKLKNLETSKVDLNERILSLQNRLLQEKQEELKIKDTINSAYENVRIKESENGSLEHSLKKLSSEIEHTECIALEDMGLLKEKLVAVEVSLQSVNFNYKTLEKNIKELVNELEPLKKGDSAFPRWVIQFKHALEHEKVPYLILADNISIKPDFIKWISAIEAYLGRERYRIVTSEEFHLQAKKIQEESEYGARVSNHRSSKQLIKNRKSHGNFIALRNAIEVTNESEIGGYLDYLNDIYLVESVEEGHQLSQEGYKSLTQKGLLQDQDGGLFLKAREMVCGHFAREKYKKLIEEELESLSIKLISVQNEKIELEQQEKKISERIDDQVRLFKLPQLLNENEILIKDLAKIKIELESANKNYQEANELRDGILHLIKELEKELVQKVSEKVALKKEIIDVGGSINGYRGSIGVCKNILSKSIVDLQDLDFDDHAISFIDIEIIQDNIFLRDDGTEWNFEELEKTVKIITEDIEDFEKNNKIDQGIIAMVEPQRRRVDSLNKTYDLAKEDREKWETQLALAEIALKNHVQETMSQYIDEFKSMAELLGAKGEGKFQQEGPSYLNWKIQMKIGFDGKELVDYDDPEFSSGQRAAISIMLLLAAVSNQKEGTQNSLMFLDEPTSRVDDARANEIGTILQKSNIQYFITHQVSESLKSIDWINHAFVTSKLRSGQKFADNPIFESRREN